MIIQLKKSDIKGLNSLPPSDWQFDYEAFLRDFIAEDFFFGFIQFQNNKIVGTGNVFLKNKVGWLTNIMVDKNSRGRGLGYEMTSFLVKFLKDKRCDTQLLMATELGESVYKKIGFRKLTEYQCYDSEIDSDFNFNNSIRKLMDSDLESVYKLDQAINGENRAHLINKYYKNGFAYFNSKNSLVGFYLPEFGRGLILSREEQAGIELLKLKHSSKGRRTLLPIENKHGIRLLEKIGLKKGDNCSRMILGKMNKWKPENIYSYGSGYFG